MKKPKTGKKFERATETARAIVDDPGASDPDLGFRRFAAGVQVLERHFDGVQHAVDSRPDWPAVCQAVADANCGLGADDLLEGLRLAVQQEGGDVAEPTPSSTPPPTPEAGSPLDTTKLLEELGRWATFVRENVPVPDDLLIPWDCNNASDAEIARILRLTGGAFSLHLTSAEHRVLCNHLDDVLRAAKALRRFLYEQGRNHVRSEGDVQHEPA